MWATSVKPPSKLEFERNKDGHKNDDLIDGKRYESNSMDAEPIETNLSSNKKLHYSNAVLKIWSPTG